MRGGFAPVLLGVVVVALLGAAFVVGFSISSSDEGGDTAARALTADDLARYASGTPEREVVEWWRDVQFGNPSRVETHYVPEAGVSVEDLEGQLQVAGAFFDGVPRIDDVDQSGDIATVYALVIGSATPEPVALRLVREGSEWKLADNHLLESLVEQRERATGEEASVPAPDDEGRAPEGSTGGGGGPS